MQCSPESLERTAPLRALFLLKYLTECHQFLTAHLMVSTGHHNKGFTIVELRDWRQIFEVYKAATGSYPTGDAPGAAGYCLGTGFPVSYGGVARCRQTNTDDPEFSYTEADSQALMNRIKTVAEPSRGTKRQVDGWVVGPWVEFRPDWNEFNISTVIDSEDEEDCTKQGFIASWSDDDSPAMICTVNVHPAW